MFPEKEKCTFEYLIRHLFPYKVIELVDKTILPHENERESRCILKVQVGKDQEKAQSEKDPYSKNRDGK